MLKYIVQYLCGESRHFLMHKSLFNLSSLYLVIDDCIPWKEEQLGNLRNYTKSRKYDTCTPNTF